LFLPVIPAQAEIQEGFQRFWIPAFAGMTPWLNVLSYVVYKKT
jgi:hypothetical protein